MIEALDRLGRPYEVMACDPDLADTVAFCEAYAIPLDRSANTIVVSSRRPEGRHVACVVLATDRLDVNGEIRRRLDVKKASFAPAEETVSLTGMMIGGVTPFGLPEKLPIWIDARVMALDWVILGAGSRSAKVRIDPALLSALGNATVVDGLAKPAGPIDDV
ncbi:MAG TPA: YbaK/EbsC family protein [Acidimicrobiia bacterium]|nr:YbaK/EbsC family protein [Acidimicrobiia bacterium]